MTLNTSNKVFGTHTQASSFHSLSLPSLLAATFIAAGLQLFAVIQLQFLPPDLLRTLIGHGPGFYLLAFALSFALLGFGWYQSRRLQIHTRLLIFVVLGGVLSWLLKTFRPTWAFGLIYYGELLLHHFVAVLCGLLCWLASWRGFRSPTAQSTPWFKFASLGVLALITLSVIFLLGYHFSSSQLAEPFSPWVEQSKAIATLGLWTSGLLTALIRWNHFNSWRTHLVTFLLFVPLILRISFGFRAAIHGHPLASQVFPPIFSLLLLTGIALLVLWRPAFYRLPLLILTVLSAACSLLIHRLYVHQFGFFEQQLTGVIRSFLGFDLPYPGYLQAWQLYLFTGTIFVCLFLLARAFASKSEHAYGLSFGIILLAGIGFSNAQLVLLYAAGLLTWIHLHSEAKLYAPPPSPPPVPIDQLLKELAETFALALPVSVQQKNQQLLWLRGTLQGIDMELRARQLKTQNWHVQLSVGIVGRRRPQLHIAPENFDHFHHEEHVSHKNIRQSLAVFPRAHAQFWTSGCRIEFGDELGRMDTDHLRHLILLLLDEYRLA